MRGGFLGALSLACGASAAAAQHGHGSRRLRVIGDSAQLEVLRLAYARPPLRVSELPRESLDSTTAVAVDG